LINVRCLGHIQTSVGSREVSLEGPELEASEIVERLRTMSGKEDPGFTKYNTLVMVESGEAFVTASVRRVVKDGEKVVLIPFSHGG
jgi:molybdopterin converting factor small subunit